MAVSSCFRIIAKMVLFVTFAIGFARAGQWAGAADSSNPVYRLGNVGIGMNSNPASGLKLQVVGGSFAAYGSSAGTGIRIDGGGFRHNS
jgi:hypothetical protein